MSALYLKTQTPNEGIPLFKTIKEVGKYNTLLIGDAPQSVVYEINYKDSSFEILDVSIHPKEPKKPKKPKVAKSLSQCDFIHFPLEIQKAMVNRSVSKSIIPFLINKHASDLGGGFDWNETPEGLHFWSQVISKKNFELFFQLKDNKTNLKQQQNENQLQRKEIPHNGGDRQNTTGVLCRRRKARITVKHLGHQKIIGRG